MGKPYGARAIVWKSRIMRLEPYPRAFIGATRSISYVWNRNLDRLLAPLARSQTRNVRN